VNGVGWVCDECGKTVVMEGDHFILQGPGQPPDGWYLLFKAQPERAANNERWEFCSIECIHRQTQPVGPLRYEPASSMQRMEDPYEAGRKAGDNTRSSADG
jgi:hypothetical protein